ncbi:2-amino-4-hydroxy-6-hydroxymethyldihydropteridine diphosphokinase [Paenibacillus aceti]|uniref:2-amino-4-hydroxy-6-hydroxymethyldihydropteridine diphosphokinase n=1 Tax=Paenibacillus aceti TaxID=1820010 RepID=A0ABQ1W380_9BACL|nr:2-amino-4-hydroxy-6-hydroxymethyldihydropteridine diphosphokinase [Paenibacillus aceti]GGG10524.1 2-amino-4-hydroxy-6-hydroxymethyldihydropteridine pyrophosphokinase [Paenibacillus aceti]
MTIQTTSDASEAYIALGANLGDREATLMEAIGLLDEHPEITVLRCSNMYETDPVGYEEQPDFVNMAIALRTALDPETLLEVLLQTELSLGRERIIRWGPRTVDLDLLWVEGQERATSRLILPHPRMFERAFVLVPLADVVPAGEASGLYRRVHEALAQMDDKGGVRFWRVCNWGSASAHSES